MTIEEARQALSGKLIFGDARQIEAVNLLASLNKTEVLPPRQICEDCKGAGIEMIEIRCGNCAGNGWVVRE